VDGALMLEGRRLAPFDGEVADWAASGDFVFALAGGRLQRLDLKTGKSAAGTDPALSASAMAVRGACLALGGAGRIVLLDANTLGPKGDLRMEGAVPVSLAFSPDCALIAASGLDGAAHLYALPGGNEVAHLPVAGATNVTALQFSADGTLLHLQAQGSTSTL